MLVRFDLELQGKCNYRSSVRLSYTRQNVQALISWVLTLKIGITVIRSCDSNIMIFRFSTCSTSAPREKEHEIVNFWSYKFEKISRAKKKKLQRLGVDNIRSRDANVKKIWFSAFSTSETREQSRGVINLNFLVLNKRNQLGASGEVMICKPSRVNLSLIGCPNHTALCHIEAKSLIN